MPLCSLRTQPKPAEIPHDITDKGCSWLDAESFGFVRLCCIKRAMYYEQKKEIFYVAIFLLYILESTDTDGKRVVRNTYEMRMKKVLSQSKLMENLSKLYK